jgi:hypothetical protein
MSGTTQGPLAEDIKRMDCLLEHIDGINDERDSIPILLAVRDLWALIRKTAAFESGDKP